MLEGRSNVEAAGYAPDVMKIRTYCRLCEGSCGLIADVESGQLVALSGDESDPISAGYICDVARASVSVLEDESRIKTPLRRTEDGWESVSWSEAIAGIADALKTVQ